MDKNLVVLEYQDNFADNFSTYAYGKIVENKFSHNCVYENTTSKRQHFENIMSNFNLSYSFISKSRVDKIENKSPYLDYKDFDLKRLEKDKIVTLNQFRINDIDYLNKDIKASFDFINTDFIKNHDILEEIISNNAIGLYINQNDVINFEYIKSAAKRLNKYIKHPILYIFSKGIKELDINIKYRIIDLHDWREEFYFLKSCRHKIIHCTKYSYSEGLWASILSDNEFGYVVYSKEMYEGEKIKNWFAV